MSQLEALNENIRLNALEKEIADRMDALGRSDPQGKVVEWIEFGDNNVFILFTDGTFFAVEVDYDERDMCRVVVSDHTYMRVRCDEKLFNLVKERQELQFRREARANRCTALSRAKNALDTLTDDERKFLFDNYKN